MIFQCYARIQVYRVTKILGVLEAQLIISTDMSFSLWNFGLNLFQAQTFGLWDNEQYKQKCQQSNSPKKKEEVFRS
jgi:hypothetical protein